MDGLFNRHVGGLLARAANGARDGGLKGVDVVLAGAAGLTAVGVVGDRVVVGRDDRSGADPAGQRGQGVAARAVDPRRAHVERGVGPRAAGPHPSANPLPCLEHQHVLAGVYQGSRGRQTGKACTNDDD